MLFLSDLDRTLIFSYKRLGEENLCVEEKDGKKLSYMTDLSAKLLEEICEKTVFIPVTTRSIEQYERIDLPCQRVRYAVCDNGGNLLIDGTPDRQWRAAAEKLIGPCREEMKKCAEFFAASKDVYFEVRTVDDTFVFTRSRKPSKTLEQARKVLDPKTVSFFENGEKIYAFPDGINKGYALKMLKERFKGKVIAAGDSLFDRDMLRAADIAVIKNGELTGEKLNAVQYSEEGDDPDFTLVTVKSIIE